MKKFLALTLVFFFSLFVVEESKARITAEELMIEGKILSSHAFEKQYPRGNEVHMHYVVAYEGTLFYCMLYNSDETTVKSGYCAPFTDVSVFGY